MFLRFWCEVKKTNIDGKYFIYFYFKFLDREKRSKLSKFKIIRIKLF